MATQAGDVRTQAREQVEQTALTVRTQASDRLHEQVGTQSTRLGDQVGSFAQALRRAGEHLDTEGNQQGANTAHQAARQADRVAAYLRNADSNTILGDVERLARRKPWVAGGVGVFLGFAASRFLKASSEERYASSRPQAYVPPAGPDADYPLTREEPATPLPVTPAGPFYEDGPDTRIA